MELFRIGRPGSRPAWMYSPTRNASSSRPNELCAELHDRTPVVLGPKTCPVWLGEEPADPRLLKALLSPYPSERMTCWPVIPRVGNAKNNDPGLIEPFGVAA